MRLNRIIGTTAFAGALAMATAGAMAQEAAKKPHVPLERPSAKSRQPVRCLL